MKMKSLIKLTMVATIAFLMSGCTTHYYTYGAVNKENKTAYIVANEDSTMLGPVLADSVGRTNYQYSFAIAATATLDSGFKYFSITRPSQFVEQLKDRNVTNYDEAYEACTSGSNSFRIGMSFLGEIDGWRNFNEGDRRKKKFLNNCDSIMEEMRDASWRGTEVLRMISYYIEMHNEDRKDNLTFNAQEVMDNEKTKGLNPEWFRTSKH